MIQMQSRLNVADNSGAKSIVAITVLGQGRKIAGIRYSNMVPVQLARPR